jgi:hypothetical protein
MSNDNPVRDFASQQLELLKLERESIDKRLQDIDRQINAWNIIIAAQDTNPMPLDLVYAGMRSAAVSNLGRDKPSASRRAIQIIRSAGTAGVRPKELRNALSTEGYQVSSGFASNRLFHLKEKGLVNEANGRYYWRESETIPQPSGESPNDSGAPQEAPDGPVSHL